jgi:hypothetical protein
MMTPKAQRIAIAEACGTMKWSYALAPSYALAFGRFVAASVPKYTEDLNAMHEAEKVLTEKGVNTWWTYVDLINRQNLTPFGQSTAVHATAAQRAEAFLRTIEKWEGE